MADSKIKKEDIEYLGFLARIKLSGEDIEGFAADFEKILGYVSALSALDTSTVKTAFLPGTENVLRPDKNEPSMETEEILSNAPEKTDMFFKVPKII
jgi:aspartyl-tRNA(Asn)/glutamyl-tRNA(Gln) amidotransferase subunit C